MTNRKNLNAKSRGSNSGAKKTKRATRGSGRPRRTPDTQTGTGIGNHRSETA